MFKSIFKKQKKFCPKKYVLFNVETFNTWFNAKDNDAIYAHPGIFLRLDKLSRSTIEDYLVKCHNLNLSDWDISDEVEKFYEEIRKDWLTKLSKS
jgi:hypothetical protein